MIVPRIDSSSVGRVVAGITSVLEQNGYRLLLAVSEQSSQKELEYLTLFDDKQVDGVILLAANVSPALTTIHYYYEESGEKSAQMLLELMEKRTVTIREIKLGYELVEHESTNIGR